MSHNPTIQPHPINQSETLSIIWVYSQGLSQRFGIFQNITNTSVLPFLPYDPSKWRLPANYSMVTNKTVIEGFTLMTIQKTPPFCMKRQCGKKEHYLGQLQCDTVLDMETDRPVRKTYDYYNNSICEVGKWGMGVCAMNLTALKPLLGIETNLTKSGIPPWRIFAFPHKYGYPYMPKNTCMDLWQTSISVSA